MLDEDGSSTLPDNLSDVGGMSGRGSPSLSGRETPLSQAGHRGNNEPNGQSLRIASKLTFVIVKHSMSIML